jgi:hypothetical protein
MATWKFWAPKVILIDHQEQKELSVVLQSAAIDGEGK